MRKEKPDLLIDSGFSALILQSSDNSSWVVDHPDGSPDPD